MNIYADVDPRSNALGPHDAPCMTGGRPIERRDADWSAEFDGHYICACTQGFTGDNCETKEPDPPLTVISIYQEADPDNSTLLDPGAGGIVEYSFPAEIAHTPRLSVGRSLWAVGEIYRLPAILVRGCTDSSTAPTNCTEAAADAEGSVYTFNLRPLPPGWYIDTGTGRILGQYTGQNGTAFESSITVSRPGARPTPIGTVHFEFLYADTDSRSTAVGPHDRPCQHDGQRLEPPGADWSARFNGRYSCKCTQGFTGDNCDVADADDVKLVLAVALVVVVGLGLGIGLALRIQLYRANQQPMNVGEMQAELLARLGLVMAEVGPGEIGLQLTFGVPEAGGPNTAEDTDSAAVYEDDAEEAVLLPGGCAGAHSAAEPPHTVGPAGTITGWAAFQAATLAKLQSLVPELGSAVDQTRFIQPGASARQVLIAIRRPPEISTSLTEEGLLAIILAAIASDGGCIIAGHQLVEACLATSRRTPREMLRRNLVRLESVGQGTSAEVFRYQVAEPQRGVPTFTVAAKTTKPVDDETDVGDAAALLAASIKELLNEAAMLALLRHRNVIGLIGVCTVPRNVPPLVLLEYCEQGSLHSHLSEASPDELGPAQLLTCCAEVLRALHYIAGRRLVHRDVSARNVLLDATGGVKLSDFGLAVALHDEAMGKDYARRIEELPLRWSSPEVLAEGKFSSASDVFAFGVLVWECFSRGAQPYSDIAHLPEVSRHVQNGGRLGVPGGCPVEVYESLMAPCWRHAASERPGFIELHDDAVFLGANEDEQARREMAHSGAVSRRRSAAINNRDQQPDQTEGAEPHTLLGPSVHHLTTVLRPGCLTSVSASIVETAVTGLDFDGLPPKAWRPLISSPEEAKIWHLVHSYAKPQSVNLVCPRDGQPGAAYVDTLAGSDHVGRASALLSYSWGYRMVDVVGALADWTQGMDGEQELPTRTYVWICSLCLNQHGFPRGHAQGPERLAAEFKSRVMALGRVLPMLGTTPSM